MSYEFYKVVHLLGILTLFTSLGGLVMLVLRGGPEAETKPLRKLLMAVGGVSMLVVFVAGFGLMARREMMGAPWPLWIYFKLGFWLVLGASQTAVRKISATWWYLLLPALGAGAAYFAIVKPT
jgi:uncharacterized membrane protein